jgi:hypothetical protein
MPASIWIGIVLMVFVLIVSVAIVVMVFVCTIYSLLYRTEMWLRRRLLDVMGCPEETHPHAEKLWDLEIDGTTPISPTIRSTRKGR